AISGIVLVPAIAIFVETTRADLGPGEYAFQSSQEWFSLLGSNWHLGVDGISAPMILLTAILTPLALLIAFEHDDRPVEIMALILFLQTGMLGVFASLDMLVFFLFYEIGLVPMYFIIYLWGGKNRRYAANKFFIFTMAGSLGLLLTIQLIAVVVGQQTGQGVTFDIPTWIDVWPTLSTEAEILGFNAAQLKYLALLGFLIAFALKVPVFPLHTWLPDAHTEAPTAGSMLLAGVLLKLGAYGFLRLVVPLFPLEWVETRELVGVGLDFRLVEVFAALAMLSIVFGAFAAWGQDDFKKLVAYSSVNHMGFVAMGIAVFAAVYGTNYAMALDARPDLVLSSFGDPVAQADVDEYLNGGDLDNLSRSERNLAAYRKLMSEYDATVVCGAQDAAPNAQNVGACTLTLPDMAADVHNATVAANGAVMQMFNHGLSAAGMFLLVGALYHKAHTRDLRHFGGLWHTVPFYGGVLIFTSMASLGLPGLNGFVGEFLVVAGSFPVRGFEVYVLISMLGLLITGAYILKGLQKVLHGPPNPEWQHYHENEHSLELNLREVLAMAPLMALMLITGLYPNWLLPTINQAVSAMLTGVLGG
ncbi:MAG: NuoM family protein, partial [Anaerolineales bacterium]